MRRSGSVGRGRGGGSSGRGDGGGWQACCARTGGGCVEFGVGGEGWWVVVRCGGREEGEGVCFCGHLWVLVLECGEVK